ncbi:KEOPS complex subunit Pcc1 [Halolamina salifodinae]|uniref:KEOPS complex subunit Pcc1 n=1 Tax=Halolamina salifodinae TaxID=1202767 RepID=A0A8T4GUD0_9EURY|nr:KEOPS complex subunit Pcc1 [Halolamina salifodinae]MBP1986000.1 KEOPS complex subunit Pcc1 [Halolamina salifodinae]
MTATHTATLAVTHDSSARAKRVFESLDPEVGGVDDDRAGASVARDGRTVEVTVEAADLSALRAGTNSWSRLLSTAEAVTAAGAQRF